MPDRNFVCDWFGGIHLIVANNLSDVECLQKQFRAYLPQTKIVTMDDFVKAPESYPSSSIVWQVRGDGAGLASLLDKEEWDGSILFIPTSVIIVNDDGSYVDLRDQFGSKWGVHPYHVKRDSNEASQ